MTNLRWTATCVALLGLASCTAETNAPATASSGPLASSSTAPKAALASFKIEGMTCGVACPPKVRTALVTGLGLKDEQVGIDYETKLVTLDLGGQPLDESAVTKAFKGTGYSIAH